MPVTEFICPNGQKVGVEKCLKSCVREQRCMFLPTLRAVAKSVDRKLEQPTVTELIAGNRETYLKKMTGYAVSPESVLYALQGQGVHAVHDQYAGGAILSEERLRDDTTSGQFGRYGQLLGSDDGVLGDLKVTSSYKIMRALGYYRKSVATGEVYKTGAKKGQPKYRQQIFTDGVRFVFEWAVQLNYYRMLLEAQGFEVHDMYIQAICRDYNLRLASERGIDRHIYLIPIKKISDRWLKRYFAHKAKVLRNSLKNHVLPPVCSSRERWHDRKCRDYCEVAAVCPYGARLMADAMEKAV